VSATPQWSQPWTPAEWPMWSRSLSPRLFARIARPSPSRFTPDMVTGLCMTLTMGGLLVNEAKLNGDTALADGRGEIPYRDTVGPPIVLRLCRGVPGSRPPTSAQSERVGSADAVTVRT